MKRILIPVFLVLITVRAFSQNLPEAPIKTNFANVSILLNSESRQKINTEIRNVLTPQNSFLDQKFERIQLLFPIIEKILEVENVPDDFKYLAVLESGLISNATSSTNAIGYWQFKDFTAKEMGLTLSNTQDDRKNIYLSTHAAANYLKKNNLLFKNWVSTAIAYTVGAGAAESIVPVEWAYASEIKLNNTPHPYIIKAIAHKIAIESKMKDLPPSNYTLVEYPVRGHNLNEVATTTNVSLEDIKKFNSWINGNFVPSDKDYILLLKKDKSQASALENQAKEIIKNDTPSLGYPKLKRLTTLVTSTNEPVFYEINGKKGILAQSGDEVAQLATKSKKKISKFLALNDMTDRDQVKEGLIYYLQKKRKRAEIQYHTLTQNQTIWDVSYMYGVRLKKLKKYNRIKEGEQVLPSRLIWLQRKRPKRTAIQYNQDLIPPTEKFSPDSSIDKPKDAIFESEKSNATIEHRVLENETLTSIANKYSTTVEELRRINNLGSNEGIKINQKLLVPNNQPEDDWVEKSDPIVMQPKPTTTKPSAAVKPNKPNVNNLSTHNVQPGETLFSIANRYGLSVEELRTFNNMSPTDILKAGQTLWLTSNNEKKSSSISTRLHTVSQGETLFSISQKYGTTIENLKALNNLTDNTIKIGQKLSINGNTPTASSAILKYHGVQKGETLFSISKKYGVTIEELRTWNNLRNNNLLSGSRIIVGK